MPHVELCFLSTQRTRRGLLQPSCPCHVSAGPTRTRKTHMAALGPREPGAWGWRTSCSKGTKWRPFLQKYASLPTPEGHSNQRRAIWSTRASSSSLDVSAYSQGRAGHTPHTVWARRPGRAVTPQPVSLYNHSQETQARASPLHQLPRDHDRDPASRANSPVKRQRTHTSAPGISGLPEPKVKVLL